MHWKPLICKSIGSKISDCSKQSDRACYLRLFWVLLHIITCFHIVANTWRHW